MVAGRRVTDAATLDVMKMVVAGKLNVDLCAQLRAAGLRPVGLHGVVRAHKRPPRVISGGGPEPIDFGHVGDVDGFDLPLLERVLDGGWLPVVACLGHGGDGAVYNINADIVANQLAGALKADALVLVTGAPGVLRDINDPSSRIARLTVAEGKRAIADGVVSGGMIPKLEESFAALALGARAIYIVSGDVARAVREPGSVGTVFCRRLLFRAGDLVVLRRGAVVADEVQRHVAGAVAVERAHAGDHARQRPGRVIDVRRLRVERHHRELVRFSAQPVGVHRADVGGDAGGEGEEQLVVGGRRDGHEVGVTLAHRRDHHAVAAEQLLAGGVGAAA